MTKIITCLFLCVAFLLQNFNSQAQITSKSYIPLDSIVSKLEKKYKIKFFYDPSWFKGRTFYDQIGEMPLDEAIKSLEEGSHLSLTNLNEIYYVFVPLTGNKKEDSEKDRFLVVGDVLNYGSKSNVQVKGKIIDSERKKPLSGAVVIIKDLGKTISADDKGRFSFVLPVGEHDLKVSAPGYDENSKILKVLSDGEITVEMYENTINLNEVTITGSVIDDNFRRTEMSVLKFDSKSIKELPVTMGESDLIKSLSLMPGIQTTGEFGTGFNVRGGSTDQNLVLIEDVPVFNTSHLFGLISVLNSDGINSMTLYKGGIPVTYGERASSVLNIKMGTEDLSKITVKGGIGIINSRLTVEIPVTPKLYILLGGRTSYSDWMLKKMPDADLMNSSASFYDLNFYASYSFNKTNKLSVFGYKSNDKFGFSSNQKYNYGNTLGSVRFTHWFSSSIYTSLLAGISDYQSGLAESDTAKPFEAYRVDNSILYKNLKWNTVWNINDKHVVTVGANGFLYDIKPGTISPYGFESKVPENSVPNEQGLEWATFLSDDYKMNDKISFEIGLRYSHYTYLGPKKVWIYEDGVPKSEATVIDSVIYNKGDKIKTYSGFEPRISMRYNFNQDNSIRLSYNRINQYINLISNTAVITPSDLWKLSDNYVKPLVCDQFAIGFFNNTKNKNYETSFEIYYKPYKNVIDYKNGAKIILNDHIEADLINAKGQNFGIETFIKKNNGKLTGWISYTFSKSLRKTNSAIFEEKINKNELFPATLDRPHNLVINGGYYINRRWRFAFTFNYNTGRPVSLPEMNYNIKGYRVAYYSDRGKYRMPDYHRLDISISRYENLKIKKSWKGYWTLSIVNVYARKNAYSIFYQKEQSPYNVNQSRYSLYKMYIIGRPLPTFTYNFIF